MATNTLSGVNATRISQLTIDALQTTLLPLFGAFTTDFSSDIADRGDTVTTRYVTNPTVQNFAAPRSSQNSVTTSRSIQLANYIGVDLGFNDREMSFSDVKLMDMYIVPALTALAENVLTSVFSLVTSANYTQNTLITAANFNAANVASLNQLMNTAKVPLAGRRIIIPPTYANTLKKDVPLQAAYAYGDNKLITTGEVPPVYGFIPHEYNGNIPANGENLAGIATAPQGILVAARPPATPRNWNGQVLNITEPNSGLTIQMRDFYDDTEQRTQFCLIHGNAVGNPGNLFRIRSA